MLQLHWKSIVMRKLVRIHMWSLRTKIQRCVISILDDLIVTIICMMIISIHSYNYFVLLCSVVFSRAAVVCLIVGTIILLAMVTVALYRSSQSIELIKGSSGTEQGMFNMILSSIVMLEILICFSLFLPSLQGHQNL